MIQHRAICRSHLARLFVNRHTTFLYETFPPEYLIFKRVGQHLRTKKAWITLKNVGYKANGQQTHIFVNVRPVRRIDMLFIFGFIVPFILSGLLIRYIERRAQTITSAPLHRWRRMLIPLQVLFFLAANLDGVLSFRSYLTTHPDAVPARYDENQAWNTDRFFYAAFVSIALLPFLLTRKPTQAFRMILPVWGGYSLWTFFGYAPLLLATGVPFRQ